MSFFYYRCGFQWDFMSRLIGVDRDWAEASSCSICSKVFCSWKLFFECGVLLLAYQVNDYTLTGIINKVNDLPQYISLIAARIITAAIIQWQSILFIAGCSAMTAPTNQLRPHACGFVNGSGILLTPVSTVLFASNSLLIL
jgi:NAD(P)H-quinone oxidoreductase subunit 5